jgi:hypothetical protein
MKHDMKTFFKHSVLWLAFVPAMALTACSTTDDGSYAAPISLYEKIGGKWVLNSLVQTDETTGKTMTLTGKLDFDTFVIHLDTDDEGAPTTFSVEGKAPVLLPTSGTWSLDRPFTKSDGTATQILLKGGEGAATLTVTAVPGATRVMEYKLTRKTGGQAYTSYTYNLMSALAE